MEFLVDSFTFQSLDNVSVQNDVILLQLKEILVSQEVLSIMSIKNVTKLNETQQ